MTVYVDDYRRPAQVGRLKARWSHLMTNSLDSVELAAFAKELGLQPEWLQFPGTPKEHYDVTDAVRLRAIHAGAKPITFRQSGELVVWKRKRLDTASVQPVQDESPATPVPTDPTTTPDGREPTHAEVRAELTAVLERARTAGQVAADLAARDVGALVERLPDRKVPAWNPDDPKHAWAKLSLHVYHCVRTGCRLTRTNRPDHAWVPLWRWPDNTVTVGTTVPPCIGPAPEVVSDGG